MFVSGTHQSWSTAKGQTLPSFIFTILCFTGFEKILHESGVLIREGPVGEKSRRNKPWREGTATSKQHQFPQELLPVAEAAESKATPTSPSHTR